VIYTVPYDMTADGIHDISCGDGGESDWKYVKNRTGGDGGNRRTVLVRVA
jgi:hypothetical protein